VLTDCFFCDAPLGRNDEVEGFPIGHRLAFDEARGRLWVVCPSCGRWNLIPIEERWEAIEQCERKFRATPVRLSTDQIGLARLKSGLELVRIGKPVLPEFAAWRYGRELHRRRLLSGPQRAAGLLGPPALILGGPVLAATLGTLGALAYAGAIGLAAYALHRRPALTIPLTGGGVIGLSRDQIATAELIRAEDEEDQWAMWLECQPPTLSRGVRIEEDGIGARALLTGPDGRAAAARILPYLNPLGGSGGTVQEAVHWLQAVGGPERALWTFARSRLVRPVLDTVHRTLATYHPEARLGLEMALHEDEERRTLMGELTILRWAWQREEPLAAIADRMLDPG
jgi:hypothetical protein